MAIAILIAAVALVGVLCLLDLLLTFGVIRRLREHTALLSGLAGPPPVLGLETGKSPGAFSAVATSGEVVTDAARLWMVGFFSSSCSACPERVLPFVEYVSDHRLGRDSVLAVIEGGDDEPVPTWTSSPRWRSSAWNRRRRGARAFEVNGFPLFFLLDADSVVAVSGYESPMLPAPAAV